MNICINVVTTFDITIFIPISNIGTNVATNVDMGVLIVRVRKIVTNVVKHSFNGAGHAGQQTEKAVAYKPSTMV